MKNHFYLSLLLAVCVIGKLHAQQPAFDHIVVVIEENHSFGDIIGNSAAPNIQCARRLRREHRQCIDRPARQHQWFTRGPPPQSAKLSRALFRQ